MTYRSAAPTYLAKGLKPVPVKGKTPVPGGATGRHGVVNEAKVNAWCVDPEWADQNVALRAEGWVAIDVDEYDVKHGAEQLADLEAHLGPLPATPSSTSRGVDSPSRQYFLALKEPVELYGKPPILGVKANDVHIEIVQFHHRYAVVAPSIHPDTGAAYVWYDADGEPMDEPPSIDDFEYLPEAWVEYLRADDREFAHSDRQWDGEIPDAPTEAEQRKLRTIASRLEGLPSVWAPGAGWHDTVFAAACWLARIARSNAYALTEENALRLLLDHTPTYRDWGAENVITQWESALKTTEGQFEEPPTDAHPPLLLWTGFPEDREFPMLGGEMFVTAWRHRPEKETSGALWSHRQKLLRALLRTGFTDQEAATIIWYSAAAALPAISFGGQLIPDGDSKCITIEDLWKEVAQAKAEEVKDAGTTIEAAPAEERPDIDPAARTYSFLTDDERKYIAGAAGDWFGRSFVDWARDTFGKINEAYYRANRWAILSVIFGNKATLPFKLGIQKHCTLYIMVLGPTTSGKSTAFGAVKQTLRNYYLDPDNPMIGGDFSPEALADTLDNRSGLPTFMYLDEAHVTIRERWKRQGSSFSAMPGDLTALYDGEQESAMRITRKTSGKRADVFLTVHLMGTYEGMVDAIEPTDYASGLMPRFVVEMGKEIERTQEDMGSGWITEDQLENPTEDDALDAAQKTYRQWAAEFAAASQKVTRADGKPARMQLPTEVKARHQAFQWRMNEFGQSMRRHTERLMPVVERVAESTLRAAALVAMSRGRRRLEMSDLLIAIEQAEFWFANAVRMVQATEESLRDRDVNKVERFVYQHGGVASMRDIHLAFPNRKAQVLAFLDELVAQGRVDKRMENGVELVRVKGIGIEKEAA